MKKKNITNLAFTGGSVKCTAYAGVAKALYDCNLIPQIERVSGVSAGAIFATAFSLGYSAEEIRDILLKLDYNKFADGNFGTVGDIYRLLTYKGMHPGKYFYEWAADLVETKTGSKDTSFADLHNSGNYLELYLISANLNTQNIEIFSFYDSPNTKIVDAIRCSMSIPIFFEPYLLNGFTYADGGVIDNYPIDIFDDEDFLKTHHHLDNVDYRSSTLGFALTDPQSINGFLNNAEVKVMDTDSLSELLQSYINIILNGAQSKELKLESDRTVYINNLNIDMFDFNISDEQKYDLIHEGYIATIDFLKNHDLLSGVNSDDLLTQFNLWNSA